MKVVYKSEGTNCEEKVCEIVGMIGHTMTRVRFENGDTVLVCNENLYRYYGEEEIPSLEEEEAASEAQDAINPSHYKQGIEVYDFIKSHDMNFAQGNVIKYVSRYNFKNGLEDLKKAKWYLDALIKELEQTPDETADIPAAVDAGEESVDEYNMVYVGNHDEYYEQPCKVNRETKDSVIIQLENEETIATIKKYLKERR